MKIIKKRRKKNPYWNIQQDLSINNDKIKNKKVLLIERLVLLNIYKARLIIYQIIHCFQIKIILVKKGNKGKSK